ncbi:hypothetical protein [Microvirga aerophila]|uniref:Uncharacterized protein n=1 Tax=Microvirga aerophila TaxID=670291 RepID=A0A512BVL1_9HYPH|nr:hypothetical protein [Microvirga aerophila]GEO16006.1 hypothetical protein MAE02_37020 [Microvirga aerophila]
MSEELKVLDVPDISTEDRALVIAYATGAPWFRSEIIRDATTWARCEADRHALIAAFPFVLDMRQYKVWDDDEMLSDDVCCWLSEHVGTGGPWESTQEVYDWADHGCIVGFKNEADALLFKLRWA